MKRLKRKKIRVFKPQPCPFCQAKRTPSYREPLELEKFLSIRGGILGRLRSGACAKHQRQLNKAIKQARHLALLPFVSSTQK